MNTEGDVSDKVIVQPTAQRRTSPPGSMGLEDIPRHPSCECVLQCSVSRPMALVFDKILKLGLCSRRSDLLGLGSYSFILINRRHGSQVRAQ